SSVPWVKARSRRRASSRPIADLPAPMGPMRMMFRIGIMYRQKKTRPRKAAFAQGSFLVGIRASGCVDSERAHHIRRRSINLHVLRGGREIKYCMRPRFRTRHGCNSRNPCRYPPGIVLWVLDTEGGAAVFVSRY